MFKEGYGVVRSSSFWMSDSCYQKAELNNVIKERECNIMIIVKLIGGLGNQMFQYAVGRHLAIKNNCRLKLDIRGFEKYALRTYDLHHFTIEEYIATADDLSGVLLPSDWFYQKMHKRLGIMFGGVQQIKYVKESIRDFIPEILILGDNVYLDGYWQSEKYFHDITDIIKKEFTIKNTPDPINESYKEDIKNCESVSVHIRRGDYISNPKTNQVHGFLGLEYYQSAMDRMLILVEEPHYYIFSDDIDWAKKNIHIDAPISYIEHNIKKSYEDMRLMSSCKHHIIANSSFSWWGAWLASNEDQIVIGPKRWFVHAEYSDLDRMPEHWLRL